MLQENDAKKPVREITLKTYDKSPGIRLTEHDGDLVLAFHGSREWRKSSYMHDKDTPAVLSLINSVSCDGIPVYVRGLSMFDEFEKWTQANKNAEIRLIALIGKERFGRDAVV